MTFHGGYQSDGQQYRPAIAMADNCDFVIVWRDDQDENGYYQILARGFTSDGSERFADTTVNTVSTGQQIQPVVAMVRQINSIRR